MDERDGDAYAYDEVEAVAAVDENDSANALPGEGRKLAKRRPWPFVMVGSVQADFRVIDLYFIHLFAKNGKPSTEPITSKYLLITLPAFAISSNSKHKPSSLSNLISSLTDSSNTPGFALNLTKRRPDTHESEPTLPGRLDPTIFIAVAPISGSETLGQNENNASRGLGLASPSTSLALSNFFELFELGDLTLPRNKLGCQANTVCIKPIFTTSTNDNMLLSILLQSSTFPDVTKSHFGCSFPSAEQRRVMQRQGLRLLRRVPFPFTDLMALGHPLSLKFGICNVKQVTHLTIKHYTLDALYAQSMITVLNQFSALEYLEINERPDGSELFDAGYGSGNGGIVYTIDKSLG
ncbi:hypothetical protein D9758_006463 [Tetrapyrgos nigripes]|uniref:Uncharacterized protein n=1 Tax=Tetrapyrgos nigripes TaxID=182062 RepID=A0A8H5GL01_9AGAR|nr:hypothetical protein D9758_006463 [Tetrapyrgos nigripes]